MSDSQAIPQTSTGTDESVMGHFDHGLTLALSKGRILKETLPLLKNAGIELLEDPDKSRKLIFRPLILWFVS